MIQIAMNIGRSRTAADCYFTMIPDDVGKGMERHKVYCSAEARKRESPEGEGQKAEHGREYSYL